MTAAPDSHTPPSTRRFFDGRARDYYQTNYDAPRDRHAYNLALRRAVCLELLPRVDGRVLDLGCGPGAMTIPLLARGDRVVSIDLSTQMVIETARRAHDLDANATVAIAVAAADATALPLRDGSLAAVVTTGVLEYVRDVSVALAEIRRVLQPGGLVIATMSLERSLERAAVRTFARLRGRPATARQYVYGRAAFDALVEAAGFAIDARTCCTFAPFPLDALWPASVPWIDRVLGRALNRSDLARDQAKTYIVRARRTS